MPLLPTASDRNFSCVIRVNGNAHESLLKCVQSVTVEEDLDVGSSCSIELQACRNDDGSWPYLEDENLQVWNRITVLAAFPKQTEVVFDGYISHIDCQTHESQSNITVSIRGVDASYHMVQEDKAKIWRNMTYEAIAEEIINSYGFIPFIDDNPPPSAEQLQIAQRGNDHRFLRELARRRGYEFYVMGANAYFRRPQLTGKPQKLIAVNFGDETNCHNLQFGADGTAPTMARLSYFDAKEGQAMSVTAQTSGLAGLGAQPLSERRGAIKMPPSARIARGHGFNSSAQVAEYTAGMLRRSAWWVTANGTLDGAIYGTVLRSRKTVTVKGVGGNYNGVYYVRKVRHQLTMRTYQMTFELGRNGVGRLGTEDFQGESASSMAPLAAGPGIDEDTIEVAPAGPRVLPA